MEWKTVVSPHSERINVKRSEFYATVFPVKDEKDFRKKLKEISKRDATHNCWAYRIFQQREYSSTTQTMESPVGRLEGRSLVF